MGRDRAELHLRHHRQSEGRRLSPPRRLPARARQRRSPAACGSTRSICGRCRCSTATAGASPGRSRSSPARMCACARCAPRRCTTRSPTHKVTHLCGAPIVMSTILNAPADEKRRSPQVVEFFTAAAPPPEAVLAGDGGGRLRRHACLRPDRDLRPGGGQRVARAMGRAAGGRAGARKKARQGVRYRASRGARRARSRDACSRCRATARPSAR